MRIAVAVKDGGVSRLFEESEAFRLFEAVGTSITRDLAVPSLGTGAEGLTASLSDYRANVLICGAISGKAMVSLGNAGILTVGGVSGDPLEAVRGFLDGSLSAAPERSCGHDSCADCASENCNNCKIH